MSFVSPIRRSRVDYRLAEPYRRVAGSGLKRASFHPHYFRGSQSAPQFNVVVPDGQNRPSSKLLREVVSHATFISRFELDPAYVELLQGETLTIRWAFGTTDPRKGPWDFKLSSVQDASGGTIPVKGLKAGWEAWLVPLLKELCRPVGLNYRKITALGFRDDKQEDRKIALPVMT